MSKILCGIDEAGRGALAGPLVVAGCVLANFKIQGLDDSKKLTSKKRELIFNELKDNSKFLIVYFSNTMIDKIGLSQCLREALISFERYFKDYELLYDGNTNYQTGVKTLIKADSKVQEVAAASILAKVSRDRLMDGWDKIYPEYGYISHKGYGTKKHLEALEKFGNSPLSRESFEIKKKITQPKLEIF